MMTWLHAISPYLKCNWGAYGSHFTLFLPLRHKGLPLIIVSTTKIAHTSCSRHYLGNVLFLLLTSDGALMVWTCDETLTGLLLPFRWELKDLTSKVSETYLVYTLKSSLSYLKYISVHKQLQVLKAWSTWLDLSSMKLLWKKGILTGSFIHFSVRFHVQSDFQGPGI